MANFFRSVLLRLQNKSVTAGTSNTSVSADTGYDGLGTVTVSPTPSETKTQAAGTSNIDVTPSSGKLLSKVTVTPTPTETASATPSTTAQTITPSSGKYLSSVSVSAIQTQTKSATPSTTAQTITPDSGKYLTSVSVGAISTETKTQAAGTSNIDVTPTSGKYLTKVTITPLSHTGYYPSSTTNVTSNGTKDLGANHSYRYVNVSVPNPTLSGDADEANVLSGKKFYKNNYTLKTGSMTNRGAWTSTGNNCNASSTKDVIIPEGYHNGSGYVRFNSLASQTGVDSGQTAIDTDHVLDGYQGWVNGTKVTGSYVPQSSSPINSNWTLCTTSSIKSYPSYSVATDGLYLVSVRVCLLGAKSSSSINTSGAVITITKNDVEVPKLIDFPGNAFSQAYGALPFYTTTGQTWAFGIGIAATTFIECQAGDIIKISYSAGSVPYQADGNLQIYQIYKYNG